MASLTACSKEPTESKHPDLPIISLEERAKIQLESAPDQLLTRYTNDKFGYVIDVPRGWGELRANVTVDGASFINERQDSVLRLSGDEGGGLDDAARRLAGAVKINDGEYRGAMTQADGKRVEFRLLKAARGIVIARFLYPVGHIEIALLAKPTLDSLKLQ